MPHGEVCYMSGCWLMDISALNPMQGDMRQTAAQSYPEYKELNYAVW